MKRFSGPKTIRLYRGLLITAGLLILSLIIVWSWYYSVHLTFLEELDQVLALEKDTSELNRIDEILVRNRQAVRTWSKTVIFGLQGIFLFRMIVFLFMKPRRGLLLNLFILLSAVGLHQLFISYHKEEYKHVLDAEGVPFYYYGIIDHQYTGFQRNPLFVMNQSFDYFNGVMERDSVEIEKFMNCANWCLEHQKVDGDLGWFEYQFDFPTYNLKAPWISSLANAKSLRVFICAYSWTAGDTIYMNAAKRSLNYLQIPVDDGGMVIKDAPNRWWFAEYPTTKEDCPRVLNGMVSVVMALEQYVAYTNDSVAKEMYENGVNAIVHELPKYDNNGATFYDQRGETCTKIYHHIYIRQMRDMYKLTGHPIFKEYYDKWLEYAMVRGWW